MKQGKSHRSPTTHRQSSPKTESIGKKVQENKISSQTAKSRTRVSQGQSSNQPRSIGIDFDFHNQHLDNADQEVQKIFFSPQVKDNSSLADLIAQQRSYSASDNRLATNTKPPSVKPEIFPLVSESEQLENDESIVTEVSSFMFQEGNNIVPELSALQTPKLLMLLEVFNREYQKRLGTQGIPANLQHFNPPATNVASTTPAAKSAGINMPSPSSASSSSNKPRKQDAVAPATTAAVAATELLRRDSVESISSLSSAEGQGQVHTHRIGHRRSLSGDPSRLRQHQRNALELSETRMRAEASHPHPNNNKPTKSNTGVHHSNLGAQLASPSSARRPQTPSKHTSASPSASNNSGRGSATYSIERLGAAPPSEKMFGSAAVMTQEMFSTSPPAFVFLKNPPPSDGAKPVTHKPNMESSRPFPISGTAKTFDDVSVGSGNSAFSFGGSILSHDRTAFDTPTKGNKTSDNKSSDRPTTVRSALNSE